MQDARILQESDSNDSDTSDDVDSDDYLHSMTRLKRSEFMRKMRDIKNSHHLSNRCLVDVLSLFKASLPPTTDIPTYYEIMKDRPVVAQCVYRSNEGDTEFVILDFATQITSILQRNAQRLKITSPYHVKLILSSDGGQLFKSTTYSIWPIFLTLADLPSDVASLLNNVCLAALWKGSGKPLWDDFMGRFANLFCHHNKFPLEIEFGGNLIHIHMKIISFVADMPAKSSVLNFINFNGYFGCPSCYLPGEIICLLSLLKRFIYFNMN